MDDRALVEEYLRKKGLLDDEQRAEQERADNMRMAAGALEGLGSIAGNSGPGVVYYKGWGESGSPEMSKGKIHAPNMETLRAQAANVEQRAEANHRQGLNSFDKEQSLTDLSTKRRREQEVENDANAVAGPEADSYRSLFAKHFPKMDVSGMSVKEMKGILDPVMKSAGMDNDAAHRANQLKISQQNADAKTTKAGVAADGKPVSDKMLGELTAYDNTLRMVGGIREDKKAQDTGPVSAAQNYLARGMGIDDPQKSGFRAKVQTQLAAYIKEMSGAAASDQERAFLMENTPTVSDNDETFEVKLKNVEDYARMKKQNLTTNLEAGGRNVSGFKQSTGGQFPRQVRDSQGNVATVSNEQELKEAQAEGFN